MFRPVSLLALAATAVFSATPDANANPRGSFGWSANPIRQRWAPNPVRTIPPIRTGTPQTRWLPPVTTPAPPLPAPARQWYFGMSVEIAHTAYGAGLQIASVTPNSPVAQSGLEQGDVLLMANSVSLQNAFSNTHGVQLLNSAVSNGTVALTVINARTGQPIHINVRPFPVGGVGAPAPAVAAPARAF